ncbi:hypothetical protein D3C76_1400470 [compost metagenome]
MGQPGRQHHNHQGQQHEQLGGARGRDLVEQLGQQPATDQEQADKQHHGLAQGNRQGPIPGLSGRPGKHRHHGQQQDSDHVLEQQHANGVLAMGAEDLAQAGQLFADDGRGGQRQAGPQQDRGTGLHARHVQGST